MKEYKYEIIGGIKCYNPESAKSNDYYPPAVFEELDRLVKKNFWFKSRNRLISYLFKKYIHGKHLLKTLEVGCGTGFVLSELQKFKNLELTGAEIFIEGLAFAVKKLPGINFIQLDVVKMKFENEFDVICAFDVLEHIEQDTAVIQNIYKALKPGGHFIISVPQHQRLWSVIDELSNHKRRYSKKELKVKLEQSDFNVVYNTSFVFLLFPLMILSRVIHRNKLRIKNAGAQDLLHELKIPSFVNNIFSVFMNIEYMLIRLGLRLPFGGSLIIAANKKNKKYNK